MSEQPHPLIRWDGRFNTGQAAIDRQHRELVDLLNRFAAEVEGLGSAQLSSFEAFKDALRRHFICEEETLRKLEVDCGLLEAHVEVHRESMKLLEVLGGQLINDPRKYASAVLAEIAHCLLVDLLDEDRFCFMSGATSGKAVAHPPIAPALQAFGRLFDLLNENHERIAQARDYYLTLLDDFPTPIFRTDADGHVDWFNHTWLSLTGQPHAAAASGGWIDAVHPEDEPEFTAAWQRNLAARLPFTTEYRLADAAGAWCWVHQIGHPFFDAAGDFRGYICTLFDITERKAAEASLRVSAAVFEHASEAIMITDAGGRIEAVNPAFSRITGYSTEEVVGASANLLRSGLHDGDFFASLWQAIASDGRWQGEVINRRKNGGIFPVWLSITSIRDANGRIARMVGVFGDITSARTSPEHLMHVAHHDALTGLPNRLLFDARAEHSLERCAREGSKLAIVFIDLDGFKPVNDMLGHKTGDRVLREVGARLQGMLRLGDTVARFGGDEFVVLIERVEDRAAASGVAAKILAAFPFEARIDEVGISVAASVGISLYPEDGGTVDELVEAADRAMYRDKNAKRPQ
jgi:diguanylate cyclase (GGDEF)-like protein/PAS domain S-box-containing protein/hemerythrin-like metal-binding protein